MYNVDQYYISPCNITFYFRFTPNMDSFENRLLAKILPIIDFQN